MRPVQHLIAGAARALAFAALVPVCAFAQDGSPVLHDQTGHVFTLASIANTPVILTFVAAHCVDTCPIINAQFADMQRQVRRSRLPIRLLTLTLDPQHDGASEMRGIAKTFHADPRYWIVGNGAPKDIRTLMRRFNVTASRGNRKYDDIHTTFVYMLDRHGRLVKTMLASTNLTADLFAELQRNWNKLNV